MNLSASVIKKLVKMLQSGELTAQELGVAVPLLSVFDNSKTSYSQLEKYLHLSHNTIKICLKKLERVSVIVRTPIAGNDGGLEINSKPTSFWWHHDGTPSILSYSYQKESEEVLADLNKIARRPAEKQFKLTKGIRALIIARFRDGHSLEDFKTVHRNMMDWLLDDKMFEYYRPETLYRPLNFDKYLVRITKARNDLRTTSKWKDEGAEKRAKEATDRFHERMRKAGIE